MSSSHAGEVVSVLIADSHPLFLIGLRHAIEESPNLAIVAATRSGMEALSLIQRHRPHVAVLDTRLRDLDGREVMRRLSPQDSPTRVLLLSEVDTGELILQCLTTGAAGVLTKYAEPVVLQEAILASSRGESVLPADVGSAVAEALTRRGEASLQPLSDRQLEMLRLLAEGESAASIALRLQIGIPTVKSHVQNLFTKLGVNDRGAAVATGIRRGLIE